MKNKIYKESSILICKHKNNHLISEVKNVIYYFFNKDIEHYKNLSLSEYRSHVNKAQIEINNLNTGDKITSQIRDEIFKYLNTESILIQSNVYLRASRPHQNINDESIG